MKIIYDTNTVIYASTGEQLSSFFEFKRHIIFIAKDLFNKEMEKYQKDLELLEKEGKLKVISTTPRARDRYQKLFLKYPSGVSPSDLMCLAVALSESLDAIATADHQLRSAAKEEGCQPLWVLDLVGFLLEENIFNKEEAIQFYKKAYKGSERKFQADIDRQLAKY